MSLDMRSEKNRFPIEKSKLFHGMSTSHRNTFVNYSVSEIYFKINDKYLRMILLIYFK